MTRVLSIGPPRLLRRGCRAAPAAVNPGVPTGRDWGVRPSRPLHPSLRPLALAAAVVLAAAGCSGDDDDGSASATATTATTAAPSTGGASPVTTTTIAPDPLEPVVLPCEQSIGNPTAPPDGFEVVLDAVALPTATAAESALQTSKSGEPDPGGRLFAKTGLVVRAGTSFEVVVPEDARPGLSIGWGSPAVRTIDLAGDCPGDGWLAYAGGYWVDSVGCRSVVVKAGGREQTVQIGIGAPCAGQSPPPQPTET
jgi:hypothetical protein